MPLSSAAALQDGPSLGLPCSQGRAQASHRRNRNGHSHALTGVFAEPLSVKQSPTCLAIPVSFPEETHSVEDRAALRCWREHITTSSAGSSWTLRLLCPAPCCGIQLPPALPLLLLNLPTYGMSKPWGPVCRDPLGPAQHCRHPGTCCRARHLPTPHLEPAVLVPEVPDAMLQDINLLEKKRRVLHLDGS